MHKLKINNLAKSYQNHMVLQNVSFVANRGDVIALMGSSGSGKSTLLRCINLLTIPDAGAIQVDTQIVNFNGLKTSLTTKQMMQLRMRVGIVFQQFNLWAHMTVLENLIEAPIHVLKRNKHEVIAEAESLLKKVGLSSKKDCYPAQISGGQQQRAAIARALMMRPEIMLFDEPTSALDPEIASEVFHVMQTLIAEGMTMVIATHELNFARRISTQAVFLEHGQVVEQGVTKTMFSHPQTKRFCQFLEAMHH